MKRVVAVVIGCNERDLPTACLVSNGQLFEPVTYDDSGSTDVFVAAAQAQRAHVVYLDTSTPLTATRARYADIDA